MKKFPNFRKTEFKTSFYIYIYIYMLFCHIVLNEYSAAFLWMTALQLM